MAIAATGPAAIIKYDDLREKLSEILAEESPQKHEITSALIHLSNISKDIAKDLGNDAGVDWDEDERKVDISDPYLRFYLRWHIRPISISTTGGQLVLPSLQRLFLGEGTGRVFRFIRDVDPKKKS
jgi:hypothetical protein